MCHGQQSPFLASSFVENCYKEEVIGKDSLDVEVIWETLYNKARPFGQQGIAMNALSGIDIALWDLNGKQLKQPISRLIGGRFREKLAAYATGFYRLDGKKYPETSVEDALKFKEEGIYSNEAKGWFYTRKGY